MMETVQHDEEWRRLHERLRGIARRRAALDAEEARCLREACDLKLWRRLGYAHMNEYLERELGYGPQVGIERLRTAYALADLPAIEANLNDGRLSYSAVRELTRVATADTEQAWLDKARGKNLREIEAMVSGRKRGDRPDDPSNPDLTKRVVRLELAPAVFALFRQTQSAMADEHGGRLDDDALVEVLCRRAMEGVVSTERPPYQIAITLCEWCGRGWQNGAGREVDVGREVVDRARCDAEMIGSLDAEDPERVRATVTPRMRRQVLARDHHRCTVPGCRSARNLDLHHIEYQSDGGSHEMSNVTVLCSAHHKCLHDDLLMIRGKAPHALEFRWREPSGPVDLSDPALGSDRADPVIDAGLRPDRADPVIDAALRPDRADPVIDAALRPDRADPVIDAALRPDRADPVIDAGLRSTRRQLDMGVDASEPPKFGAPEDENGPAAIKTSTQRLNDRLIPAAIEESARAALVTAGYKSREARAAVENARPHVGASATLEQVIREALHQCATSIAARGVRQSSS